MDKVTNKNKFKGLGVGGGGSLGSGGCESESSEAGGSGRARSRSRSPAWTTAKKQLSKQEKKKRKREKKKMMEEQDECAGGKEVRLEEGVGSECMEKMSVDECMNVVREGMGGRIASGIAGGGDKRKNDAVRVNESAKVGRYAADRPKHGMGEVYVVCEDVRQSVRKVKVEAANEECLRMNGESECGRDLVGASVMEAQAITKGLRTLLLNDANKVTKWMAARVLDEVAKYEEIVHRLAVENARVVGAKAEAERVSVGMTVMAQQMERMSECMKSLNERCERVSAVCGDVNEKLNVSVNANETRVNAARKKSYALIVRGEHEDLTSDEVRKRMDAEVSERVNVRVNAVKTASGGRVVVEAASSAERARLAACPGFRDAGLRVEQPKTLDPRIVAYDVPNELTDESLLRGMYEKSMKELMSVDDFMKRVRVVKRLSRGAEVLGNVIFELPMACRERMLRDGRMYVGWGSYKVSPWERVPRCFACMGYGHRMSECKSERLCWRCGGPGHRASACKSPEFCRNCQERKLHAGHSAMSLKCQVYEWRVNALRRRFSDGLRPE